MNVKGVLGVVTVLVGVAGFSFFQSIQAHAMRELPGPNLSEVDQAEILSSTLQIEISVPADASGLRFVKAEGLGSLVRDGERTLLVTHNHWGEILQEKAVVKFYDTHGQLVKTMSGSEFISLMCYLDAGTLILRSPLELKGQTQPVLESDALQVKAGDVVMVAQREGSDRKEVALVEAEVESITTIRGVPVYRLKGLEGQPVQGGDSGGGVWRKGNLIGNLWYTAMAKPKPSTLSSLGKADEVQLEVSNESFAAGYPADQPKAFQEQLEFARGETIAVP